jgi:predicted aconitase
MLNGRNGPAAQQAMRIITAMAAQQDATTLVDVSQGHIDGCIYASPANLTFAEKMVELGAEVLVPTTMNAISVDHRNWRTQGIPTSFGRPATRLADAYVRMGCEPTFTCSPYLLDSAPKTGETIAWAESNAVVFANSVLGARTAKHPDFLDLCIAMTGRAPAAGVYLDENRVPSLVIEIDTAASVNDAFWPLIGYLAGKKSPDRIPLLRGLAPFHPSRDDLKALCAAFGTTSASPMLHIEGVTPEAGIAPKDEAVTIKLTERDLDAAWQILNDGPEQVELVAIGSPHASIEECRELARALETALRERRRHPMVSVIVTAGQSVILDAQADGTLEKLRSAGVQVLPDLCWCSISEPLFPADTKTVMTNSGKYTHYGPGLSGRPVRLASPSDCIEAAISGKAAPRASGWRMASSS